MPEISIDLPVVGADRNTWGTKLNDAMLAAVQAVNGSVTDLEVRAGNLIAIHVDDTETDLGPLPVAPGGSDEGVASYIATPGSDTQTALNAQIPAAAKLDGMPVIMRSAGDGLAARRDWGHAGSAGYIDHLTAKAGSGGFLQALGTDDGNAGGRLLSHKNGAAGDHLVGHPGSSIVSYWQGYSASKLLHADVFKGNQGLNIYSKEGQAYNDGVTTQGSTTFTSATAAFTAGDVGKTIFQTTSRGLNDPLGSIPSGTTITSVQSATSVTLSAAAAHTGSGLLFFVAGRVPAATQSLLTFWNNASSKLIEFALGSAAFNVSTTFQTDAVGDRSVAINGISGQTADLLHVIPNGAAAGALSVLATGLVAMRFGSSLTNAGNTAQNPVSITNNGTTTHSLYITAGASQTGDQISLRASGGGRMFAFAADGKPVWASATHVQATVGAAGAAAAPPATPSKYLKVVGDDGNTYVLAAYAAS